MTKGKKGWLIAVAAVFLAMGVAYYAARQNYVHNLPVVMTVEPVKAQLRTPYEVKGYWNYTDTMTEKAGEACLVDAVMAEPYDELQAGDEILRLDMAGLNRQYYTLKLAEQEAEKSVKRQYKENEKALAQLELERVQARLAWVEGMIAQEGVIRAPEHLQLLSVAQEGDLTEREAFYTALRLEGACAIEAPVPEKLAQALNITGERGETMTAPDYDDAKLTVTGITYDAGTESYLCTLHPGDLTPGLQGEPVRLTRTVESRTYDFVVPISAVHMLDENNAMIYTVRTRTTRYGEEAYAFSSAVAVLDQNDQWVALNYSLGYPAIQYYPEDMHDGDAVRVIEP